MQDAAERAVCVETGAFGNEAYILTGYFNIPKVFELTLNNGYDKMSRTAAWFAARICKQISRHMMSYLMLLRNR
ncbi:MAG: pyruvate formate lyase family protein [Dorea sp.]